jgi:hypothetical protein
LLQDLVQDEPQGQGRAALPPILLARFAPELAPFVESIAPITAREPALCALPFALMVR